MFSRITSYTTSEEAGKVYYQPVKTDLRDFNDIIVMIVLHFADLYKFSRILKTSNFCLTLYNTCRMFGDIAKYLI